MFDGIFLRSNEIIVLDIINTKVNANAITIALSTFTVTAKAEQIPNTWRVIGLFEIIGSEKTVFFFVPINEFYLSVY